MLFSQRHILMTGPAGCGKTNCLVGHALEEAHAFRKLFIVSQFDPLYSVCMKEALGDKVEVFASLESLPPADELKRDEGEVYLVLDCVLDTGDARVAKRMKEKVRTYAERGVHCIFLQHSYLATPLFVRRMAKRFVMFRTNGRELKAVSKELGRQRAEVKQAYEERRDADSRFMLCLERDD